MITVESGGHQYRATASRVEQVADHLGQEAAQRIGGRLPEVRILITDSAGMLRAATDEDARLAGDASRRRRAVDKTVRWCLNRTCLGVTVYDQRGVLIAINDQRPRHRDDCELRRTVIHELAHAVQLGAPAARDKHTTYLRMQLGAEPRDKKTVAAYERVIETREQQATNLEALIR